MVNRVVTGVIIVVLVIIAAVILYISYINYYSPLSQDVNKVTVENNLPSNNNKAPTNNIPKTGLPEEKPLVDKKMPVDKNLPNKINSCNEELEQIRQDCSDRKSPRCEEALEQVTGIPCYKELYQIQGEGKSDVLEQNIMICVKPVIERCGIVLYETDCLDELAQVQGEGDLIVPTQVSDIPCYRGLDQVSSLRTCVY